MEKRKMIHWHNIRLAYVKKREGESICNSDLTSATYMGVETRVLRKNEEQIIQIGNKNRWEDIKQIVFFYKPTL